MLTLIIGIMVGLLLAVWLDNFAPFVIIIVIAVVVGGCLETERVPSVKHIEIVSMQDNSNITGSFFLGCGSVNSEMMYSFYKKVDDGFKFDTIPVDRATIKYTNDKPHIDVISSKLKKDSWGNYFSLNIVQKEKYIIYVPEGTIKMNYTLDAQ